MCVVEYSTQDAQLGFQKPAFLFWQRQSLNAGKVMVCRNLVVVTWFEIFHLRCIFSPHLLSKSRHPGMFPVPKVMADMRKRGQMAQCRLQPQHRACTFCIELRSHYTQLLSHIYRNVLVFLEICLSFLHLCFPISSLYCQRRVQVCGGACHSSVDARCSGK